MQGGETDRLQTIHPLQQSDPPGGEARDVRGSVEEAVYWSAGAECWGS